MEEKPVTFDDFNFAVLFSALALRVCRTKIPAKWAELMTFLMDDCSKVEEYLRQEMLAKLEQEHKLLWKEINENPLPAFFQAWDNDHVPFLEAMTEYVDNDWSMRSKAVHSSS